MNEKHLDHELVYVRKELYYVGMAAIHLAFQPSDKLEQSLRGFVKPQEQHRFNPTLMSDEAMRLRYTGGDTGGLRYLATTLSDGAKSDHDVLQDYRLNIDQIRPQSIPVAAYRPRLERTRTGAVLVELALLPDDRVKRKIGKTLLRHLRVVPEDAALDEVIYARKLIPQSQLVDNDELREAQSLFMGHLGVDEYDEGDIGEISHESPRYERMFVKTAFISERVIS